MKPISYFLIALLSILSFSAQAQLSVNGYTNYNLQGFEVLVEDRAIAMDSALTHTAINLLESKLHEISQFNLDPVKKDSLRAVPIFVDWNTTTGAAQYHPSEAWLIANGYAPEKARCVEISNVTHFINWTHQNQPYMVLHELAHAYHHRVLDFNSPVITQAFNHAVSSNLYTNVSYHQGSGNYSTQAAAYALNNEREFFAELSEAYFGLNDYFPFNNADLSSYDSVGFQTMVSVWGSLVSSTSTPSEAFDSQISIYPNPSGGTYFVDLGNDHVHTQLNEIVDVSGKRIVAPSINGENGRIIIDLTAQPGGIYFIKFTQRGYVKTLKVIKN